MTRAVIYTRVSSEEQVGNSSLDEQEKRCLLFIQAKNCVHIKTYREEGVSGAEKNRPALNHLLEDAKNGEFDTVVFLKIDRLSRSLRLFYELFDVLGKYSVQVQSVQENIDTNSPSSRMLVTMLASFAEFERDTIRDRTMMGRIASMKKGVWHGSCPYGYDRDIDKKLKINESESIYVRKFFDLFISKDPLERMTLHKVQKIVNSWKIPTKNPPNKKKANGATFWAKRTLGRILTNPVYLGGKYIRQHTVGTVANSVKVERPNEEKIKIDVPQIIEKEIFETVQRELQSNKVNAKRNRIRDTMLARLMYCSLCGRKYVPTMKNADNTYYYCLGKFGTHRENKCTSKGIKANRVEEPVWEVIDSVLSNPDLIKKKVEELMLNEFNHKKIEENINQLKLSVLNLSEKRKKLLDLHLDAHITKSEYISKGIFIDKEISETNNQILAEEGKVTEGSKILEKYGESKAYIRKVVKNLKSVNYEQKINIAHLLIKRIDINGENVGVTVGLPIEDSKVLQWDRNRVYRAF